MHTYIQLLIVPRIAIVQVRRRNSSYFFFFPPTVPPPTEVSELKFHKNVGDGHIPRTGASDFFFGAFFPLACFLKEEEKTKVSIPKYSHTTPTRLPCPQNVLLKVLQPVLLRVVPRLDVGAECGVELINGDSPARIVRRKRGSA